MKTIILTQKNRLKLTKEKHKIVKLLAYHSARLYNVGLYSVRQYYFLNGEYLPYVKNYHLCKTNEHYKLLLSDTAQQILRLVDRNFKSFFNLLKLKKQCKYSDKIGLPKYKKDNELMTISIQGRSARIKDGYVYIGLSKTFKEKYKPKINKLVFKLPKHIQVDKLQEVRIIPVFNGMEFDIEFVYKKQVEPLSMDKNRYLSIDMGLDNLSTCYSDSGAAFIIDGRYLKSVNRYYNKRVAYLKSIYDRQGIKYSKRLLRLKRKRDFRINNYFNLAVKYIADYCIQNKIGNIVIGDFRDIKQEINLGKKNNQNFTYIPYYKFKQKLKLKCEQLGISYILQDESYTSKASFIDMDTPANNTTFSGYRIKRGLYQTKDGLKVNADVNGAANILVKYLKSNGLSRELENLYSTRYGCVNHPVRLRLAAPLRGNPKTDIPHKLPLLSGGS